MLLQQMGEGKEEELLCQSPLKFCDLGFQKFNPLMGFGQCLLSLSLNQFE